MNNLPTVARVGHPCPSENPADTSKSPVPATQAPTPATPSPPLESPSAAIPGRPVLRLKPMASAVAGAAVIRREVKP